MDIVNSSCPSALDYHYNAVIVSLLAILRIISFRKADKQEREIYEGYRHILSCTGNSGGRRRMRSFSAASLAANDFCCSIIGTSASPLLAGVRANAHFATHEPRSQGSGLDDKRCETVDESVPVETTGPNSGNHAPHVRVGNEQFDALEDFLHETLANLGNALGSLPIENVVEIVQCRLREADSNLGHAI